MAIKRITVNVGEPVNASYELRDYEHVYGLNTVYKHNEWGQKVVQVIAYVGVEGECECLVCTGEEEYGRR